MRFQLSLLLATLASNTVVQAFAPTTTSFKTTTTPPAITTSSTELNASLSPEDNLLSLFERTVKQGPASLSPPELTQLKGALNFIITDLNRYDGTPAAAPPPPPPAAAYVPPPAQVEPAYVHEHNSEMGAEYDGTGGMGLAADTVNTYVIEGMEQMSPEEYREALQKSVSARQERRRQSGVVGNLQSNNYLDNLNK